MAIPDYYAILEVNHSATAAEIKKSYRRLVRRYHPDLNGQSASEDAGTAKTNEASKRIALLNEAYNTLSDSRQRAAYDARRRSAEVHRTIDHSSLAETQAPRRQTAQAVSPMSNTPTPQKQEPKMTWIEGVFGFVREFRKAMREE
jgi:curved DNA-binding protein CbpA